MTTRGTYVFRSGKLVTKDQALSIDAASAKAAERKYANNFKEIEFSDTHAAARAARNNMRRRDQSKRSHLPSPGIISDVISTPFLSTLDGKTHFDSKSAWHKHLRASGCSVVEQGSAPARKMSGTEDIKQDIVTAMQKVEQGHVEKPLRTANGEFGDIFERTAKNGVEFVRGDGTNDAKPSVVQKRQRRGRGGK
jgi:hypothetical protein